MGWVKILLDRSPTLSIELAERHRPGDVRATRASKFATGSYNMCCTVAFEDGYRVLVRFPALGRSRLRFEKTSDEILIMGFLA